MEQTSQKAKQDAVTNTTKTPANLGEQPITTKQTIIQLTTLNNSGQAGTATIKDNGNDTITVDVLIKGGHTSLSQPAHIHVGTCSAIGLVKYPLASLEDGTSTTTISVSYDQLMKELPLAINVHKSETNITTYIACGNIASITNTPSLQP